MRNFKVGAGRFVAYSRIGNDGRATIPATIRRNLRLQAGDEIVFVEMPGGIVLRRKRARLDFYFLRGLESNLDEWNSLNDDRAFRDL